MQEPAALAAPVEKPRKEKNRPAPVEQEVHQLAELSEGKLLEMVDDALAGWEDAS
ncbi:hypothetical protein ACN28S_34995 [Cystobacter fuscus]